MKMLVWKILFLLQQDFREMKWTFPQAPLLLMLVYFCPQGHGRRVLYWIHQTLLQQSAWLLEKENFDSLLYNLWKNYCCSMGMGILSSHRLTSLPSCVDTLLNLPSKDGNYPLMVAFINNRVKCAVCLQPAVAHIMVPVNHFEDSTVASTSMG